MAKSDLVDIELCLHHETEKAYLVSDDGERSNAVWVPKSQCERGPMLAVPKKGRKSIYEFTMSEQTAIDKGLA